MMNTRSYDYVIIGGGALPRLGLGVSGCSGSNGRSVLERDRGFADSPLEGSGFELPVPREKRYRDLTNPGPSCGGSSKTDPGTII